MASDIYSATQRKGKPQNFRATPPSTNSNSETMKTTNSTQEAIIPQPKNPFFIVTPPYTRISAGITVLHALCHYLNTIGENAFILHYPPENDPRGILPSYAKIQKTGEFPGGMNAPLLTQNVIDYYHEKRITPIVIYPEVFDNPFDAPFFARYILNYPGLLAPKYTQQENFSFAYSRILANHSGIEDTLYICTSDLNFFNKRGAWERRSGTCFYAGKYQRFLGGRPKDVPAGSVEILHSKDMSREEVREIFWRSEAFYCYEDTALATEAALCGCPVIFVPNEHFSGVPLASIELGHDGSCLADEPDGIRRAKDTVENAETNVRASFTLVPERIAELAAKMKNLVSAQPYAGTITYPFEPRLVFFEPLGLRQAGFKEGETTYAEADAEARSPSPNTEHDHQTVRALAEQMEIVRKQSADLRDIREHISRLDSGHQLASASRSASAEALAAEVHALRTSTSWRITAPLRAFVIFLRKIRGK